MSNTVCKIPRSANMDLLRILSMVLIIFLHSIDHSGVLEQAPISPIMIEFWVRFLYMLTQVCVNLFVLISGYFLINSKFRLHKLVALWLEVVFYSFTIKLIFMIVGYDSFSIVSLLSCFVPVFTGRYWFITIYFGLYLVFPFLNILIKSMNKKQHTLLNVVLFLLFSVSISVYPTFKGMNTGGGWGLAWFVVLYCAAAWFRLYYVSKKRLLPLTIWLGSAFLIATGYIFTVDLLPMARTFFNNQYRYDSVAAYVSSLCLLAVFINIKISNEKLNKFISFIATSIFGVYLIHTHSSFSPWSWECLNLPQYMNTIMFPVIQTLSVIAIMIACLVIDIIRRYTIGRVEKSLFVKIICDNIQAKAKVFVERIGK